MNEGSFWDFLAPNSLRNEFRKETLNFFPFLCERKVGGAHFGGERVSRNTESFHETIQQTTNF